MYNQKLPEYFDEFWYKKPESLKIRNDTRTYRNLRKQIASALSTEGLDRYIMDNKTRRETLRKIAVGFYDFLRNEKGLRVVSELEETRFYDSPLERQLEIAKYLQKEHTDEDIMKQFNITDTRTLRSDLRALRDGIEVLGNTIQIKEVKKGKKRSYKSTVHPVFLPLNLTEAYALCVYLPRILESGDPNAMVIRNLSNRITAQLTDYALGILFSKDQIPNVKNISLHYVSDEDLARSREGILMYLMKSGNPCSFYIGDEKHTGRVNYQNGTYCLIDENGQMLEASPMEVQFVIDDLKYT